MRRDLTNLAWSVVTSLCISIAVAYVLLVLTKEL